MFARLVKQVLSAVQTRSPPAPMRWRSLDVLQSAAQLALTGHVVPPGTSPRTTAFRIEAGRHPVVEAALPPGGAASSPTTATSRPSSGVLLLTGPNMAGKSTFLRQNALIVVLAQAGLPVPAEAMRLGVVDRLFSRVGAADDLARGRSTFMVEMTETAAILHQAGPTHAGRGRRDRPRHRHAGRSGHRLGGAGGAARRYRCRTIFATHFHELAELADGCRG